MDHENLLLSKFLLRNTFILFKRYNLFHNYRKKKSVNVMMLQIERQLTKKLSGQKKAL